MRMLSRGFALVLLALSGAGSAAQLAGHAPRVTVQARRAPVPGSQAAPETWKAYRVRTVQQLALSATDPADALWDRYGGRTDREAPRGSATGYFHTQKIADRWWMIDPAGNLYLHSGVGELQPGRSPRNQASLHEQFGTPDQWGSRTRQMLLQYGIHGAGPWSKPALLRQAADSGQPQFAYTVNLDLMNAYVRQKPRAAPDHPSLNEPAPNQPSPHQPSPVAAPPVFDSEFAAFADKYFARIDAAQEDPDLIGYFSDNELPFDRSNLESLLALPVSNPGNTAARQWMKAQHGSRIDDRLRAAFLQFEAEAYYRIAAEALRKHDRNHMYLGNRYSAQQLSDPELFRAAGAFVDAVAVNFYTDWSPDAATMQMWAHEAGKPFLVSEFYVKAEDSGLPNLSGGGWLVHTQADRGLYYQNFVLALLESRACIGWDWFKYQDNDPEDARADVSNRDSNKGVVDFAYEPYLPLLQAMGKLNLHLYQLADRFRAVPSRSAHSVTKRRPPMPD